MRGEVKGPKQWVKYYEVVTVPIGHNGISVTFYVWGIRVRVSVEVSVRVNSFNYSLSVLLRAQHYSMLTVRHRNHSLNVM